MIFVIILIFLHNNKVIEAKEYCRSKIRLIDSDKNDLYDIIDANLNEEIILQCHYCNENDDNYPKNWFTIDKLGASQSHSLQLNFQNNFTLNRIKTSLEHDLIIENFEESDRGLYYCQRLEEDENSEKFNFLVDLTSPVLNEEIGNLSNWFIYKETYLSLTYTNLKQSKKKDFQKLKNLVEIEITTIWGNWGSCEVCNRPINEGIRRRVGHCRLKLSPNNINDAEDLNEDEKFLISAYAISCRSLLLARYVPYVFSITSRIPDFIEIQHCEGLCNPGSARSNMGWKTNKKKDYKYRKTLILDELSHTSLICPESSLENTVIWKRNGKRIEKTGINNTRMYVDSFNILYLIDVNDYEEGNYTCEVDGIKMQHIKVFIVLKSRIFNYEFVRYLRYLAFILSLTTFCYCSGLVIACNNRKKFKGYRQLKDECPEESNSDTNSMSMNTNKP